MGNTNKKAIKMNLETNLKREGIFELLKFPSMLLEPLEFKNVRQRNYNKQNLTPIVLLLGEDTSKKNSVANFLTSMAFQSKDVDCETPSTPSHKENQFFNFFNSKEKITKDNYINHYLSENILLIDTP